MSGGAMRQMTLVAFLQAQRDQCVGDAVGVGVELRESGQPPFEFKGQRIAAVVRLCAHDVGEVVRRNFGGGHVSSREFLVCC